VRLQSPFAEHDGRVWRVTAFNPIQGIWTRDSIPLKIQDAQSLASVSCWTSLEEALTEARELRDHGLEVGVVTYDGNKIPSKLDEVDRITVS
jgi:hypothetical protein